MFLKKVSHVYVYVYTSSRGSNLSSFSLAFFLHICFSFWFWRNKEATLERDDFTLQLLMFVTTEKEREMFIITFSPDLVSC